MGILLWKFFPLMFFPGTAQALKQTLEDASDEFFCMVFKIFNRRREKL